jgi:hypothetical protein
MWDTERMIINQLIPKYVGEKSFHFYFVYHKSHKNPDLEIGRTKWESVD